MLKVSPTGGDLEGAQKKTINANYIIKLVFALKETE
jgi:hypothetical protein